MGHLRRRPVVFAVQPARRITREADDIRQIDVIEAAATTYGDAVQDYLDDYLQLDTSRKDMDAGAGEVAKVLDEIVQGVGKTTDLVSEIAAASQEQAQGIDQVNTAVAQMDKVTQQNAANAEESASASEELSSQAESMNAIVAELVALVGGASKRKRSTSSRSARRGTLSPSDRAYHQIAGRAGCEAPRPTAASTKQPIPLDANEELADFNT